jgi:hypothetical protein
VPPASDMSLSPYKGRIVSCYQHGALILTPGGNKQPHRTVTNLYDVWPVLCFTRVVTRDSRDLSFSTVIRLEAVPFRRGQTAVHNDCDTQLLQ